MHVKSRRNGRGSRVRYLTPYYASLGKAPRAAVRTRLRDAIRRVVSRVCVLLVPKGVDRIVAVQVWFDPQTHGDAHRARLRAGTMRPATPEEFQRLKGMVQ